MAITRREFIQGVGAAGLATAVGCAAQRAPKEPALPIPAKPILVVLFIDGGNDWLNMMIPMRGGNRSAYEAARPTLQLLTSQAFDLGEQDAGLNDDLLGIADLWSRGRVALLPGIGMDHPNLSHFEAGDLWGEGREATLLNNTGWLGRYADAEAVAGAWDVLSGVSVTGDVPIMFRGADRSFISVSSANGFVYPAGLRSGRLGSPWDPNLLETQWSTALAAASGASAPIDHGYSAAATTGKLFLDAQNRFGTDGNLTARTPSVLYPGDTGYAYGGTAYPGLTGGLSARFKLIAQMIAAGLDTRVFFARLGGWDTHSNQLNDHPRLQRALGGSIRSFYEDLATIETADGNAQARTMILAYSEFGRRVPENDGGTDHGTAGLAFCIGRSVTGGMYGDYPDLNDLDGNKNMKFTVDFRSMYATVLDRWLGQPSNITDQNLGTTYPRLNFL